MAEIDLKFMKGNRKTAKAIGVTIKPERAKTTKKVAKTTPKKKSK
jgi:hypothetical protein